MKRNVKIYFEGRGRERRGSLISYHRAERVIDRGCEVFLAIVVATTEQLGPTVSNILVVRELADVFHE